MRHRVMVPLLGLVLVLAAPRAALSQFTFTQLDVPGAIDTVARGINQIGLIVGEFKVEFDPVRHGFLFADTHFTLVDAPGGTLLSEAHGINDANLIVGTFANVSGRFHGFVFDGVTFTPLDVPGATRGTQAHGINNVGQIVGEFGFGNDHGFVFDGVTFTPLDVPGEICSIPCDTVALGINDAGLIVGAFTDLFDPFAFHPHGFLATPVP